MKQKKISAVFFLILFIVESFWPTMSFALTDGPIQPEYASFEETATTDMVNTLTGDFTYSIPFINVPSPEGGFQMPLSYHASIEMDEESSWVGLGWGLNPGVLDRAVSVYPDDFDGNQSITSTVSAPDLTGNGYVRNFVFYQRYYDSHTGFSEAAHVPGIISLSRDEANGVGANVLGLNIDKNGVSTDLKSVAGGISKAMDLATPAGLISAVFDVAAETGLNCAYIYNLPKNSTEQLKGGMTQQNTVNTKGFLGIGSKISNKYWLNKTTTSIPFGVLYFGNQYPYANTTGKQLIYNGGFTSNTTNQSPVIIGNSTSDWVSDMHVHYQDGVPYSDQTNPSSIAYDNFNVKVGGASGSISPYRLEAGSFANPVPNDEDFHLSFNVTKFLQTNQNNVNNGYKLPFRYTGDNSNSYDHTILKSGADIITKFKTDWNNGGTTNWFQVSLEDSKIYNDDVSGTRIAKEANRSDSTLFNDQIAHGKHIAWYSNTEISSGMTFANSKVFMDCGINRSNFPDNGIGGFSITREDGLTYHFTIPVYNKSEVKKIEMTKSVVYYYKVENNNQYATMWLLTGITGSDFVDRGTAGQIDDQDWGYWVKLDYGMYNSNFLWRNPYFGWSVSTDGSTKEYQRGTKQTYYLNKIKTRTHTAIFAKSEKKDGKSYYENDGVINSGGVSPDPEETETTTYTQPSVSLKLDDIYVLKNDDYDLLVTSLKNSGGTSNSKFSQFSYNNSANWTASAVNNLDANMILTSDINANTSNVNFLKQKQIQHLHFNYSYDLCPKTLNSVSKNSVGSYVNYDAFTPGYFYLSERTGKLTLQSVDLLGENDARLTPNYAFNYGNLSNSAENPDYSTDKKDDYGLYKPEASGGENTPHNPTGIGDQWSLKEITTPLGAKISVEYERDSYSNVNGYPIYTNAALKVPYAFSVSGAGTDLVVNNKIHVDSRFGDMNTLLTVGNDGYFWAPAYSSGPTNYAAQKFNFKIASINNSGGYFTINNIQMVSGSGSFGAIASNPLLVLAKLEVSCKEKLGGNLRVKSVTSTDESGNKYITKYDYTAGGITSGGASFETPWNKAREFDFYSYYDHPYTPIMYAQVTVKRGAMNGSTFEENNKVVYKFATPSVLMLNVNKGPAVVSTSNSTDYTDLSNANNGHDAYTKKYYQGATISGKKYYARSGHIIIKNTTATIGNLQEVITYNPRGEAISQTKYNYTTEWNNKMGNYGECNFMFELFKDPKLNNDNNTYTYKLFQTSKVRCPNILVGIETNLQGVVSYNSTLEFDYQTAKPIKTLDVLGGQNGSERYITQYVSAYKKYPGMRSKIINPWYKNMLAQNTQVTHSVNVSSGTSAASYKLLSAEVTAWNYHQLNYRTYNSTTDNYSNSTFIPDYTGEIGPHHPYKEYAWKSGVDKDGTIKTSDYVEFDWSYTPTLNANWKKTSEATIYSKYSRLLEYKDINDKKTSIKYSMNESFPVTSLDNCGYGEWCFSSAEDKGKETSYFGTEVKGTSKQFYSPAFSHTGNYCLKVPDGDFGFHFVGNYGTDFIPGKKYRASVWVHLINNGKLEGQLYCAINSSSSILSWSGAGFISDALQKYGSWYKLDLDITIPYASTLPGTPVTVAFGCWNPTNTTQPSLGSIYFDDFRVHPLSVGFDANVTDIKTGNVVATVDKENIATKYFYDNSNSLIRVEKETKDGFIKISEHSKNYKR